jgi:hypothetical protein
LRPPLVDEIDARERHCGVVTSEDHLWTTHRLWMDYHRMAEARTYAWWHPRWRPQRRRETLIGAAIMVTAVLAVGRILANSWTGGIGFAVAPVLVFLVCNWSPPYPSQAETRDPGLTPPPRPD